MSNINQINDFLKNILDPKEMNDYAINGIQVENDGEIKKISFAVDCSLSALQKTINDGSQLLIVHHGIFWGKPIAVTFNHKARLKLMLENDIGLIAYHLPLDCHPEYGNNIRILRKIGIEKNALFGFYKGIQIGFMGEAEKAIGIEDICGKLGVVLDSKNAHYLDFGKKEIKKVAVVSGGGGDCFEEAIHVKADLFITGDAEHELYHVAKENNINILFAGHYHTETFGVKALQELIKDKFNIPTIFNDIPTGL